MNEVGFVVMNATTIKRKIFCLFLSFVLVLSMTSLAFADELDNQSDQGSEATLQEGDSDLSSSTEAESAKEADDTNVPEQEENDSKETSNTLENVVASTEDDRAGIDYVDGEVIVVFKNETSVEEAVEIFERNDAVDEVTFTEENVLDEEAVVAEIVEGATVAEAVEELTQDPEVEYAQPNYLYYTMELDGEENDLATQTAVTINDPYQSSQWALGATKLFDTWGLAQTSQKVGVAVIDTGVNVSHADLKENIPDGSYFDATSSGKTGDIDGHGTHVAGIIAAQSNNGIGVSGSSYNAQIIPICVDSNTSSGQAAVITTSSLRVAYTYLSSSAGSGQTVAQKYNVKVINMSLGGIFSSPDAALENAIENALSEGILTIAASGNVSADIPQGSIVHPAAYDACVSVGNLAQSGSDMTISSGSIANAYVDIAAPGTNIYSTLNTGSYGNKSGTSMASPFVAGVAALLFASNENVDAESVRSALESTAIDKGAAGRDDQYGQGVIDPYEAVLALSQTSVSYTQPINPQTLDPIQCTVTSSITTATSWNWSILEGRATVDSSGLVTPTGVGNITVKATYTEDPNLSATVTITRPDIVISLSQTSFTYSGKAHTPSISVSYDGSVIPENQYTLSYYNNINAGSEASAEVVVNTGIYAGTYTKIFTINPLDISKSSSIATVSSYAYTGSNIMPEPAVKYGNTALKNGTEFVYSYKNNKNPGTATVTATFKGNYTGSISKTFIITGASITYSTHVQNYGWIGSSASNSVAQNGQMSGTSGKSLRVEALKINLVNNTIYPGGISYKTQIQNIGWQAARTAYSNGNSTNTVQGGISGTSGKSLRLETLSIELTGQLAKYYDVYYRVHAQDIGWMGWAKNGQDAAGTVGMSKRLEAIQVYLVPKTSSAPGTTFNGVSIVSANYPCAIDTSSSALKGDVAYNAMVHIQNTGNKSYSSVNGSTMLGTSGKSLRLEAFKMSLVNAPAAGSLSYEVHVQNIGNQGYKNANILAGTSGKSLRLEALRIKLTGTMATKYDIYYRTHVQNIGWTGWAKNGQWSGSAGYSYRMEAMQIVLIEKGTTAPGLNQSYYYKR